MTELQKRIISLCTDGYTKSEIAKKLGCSKSTVTYALDPEQKLKYANRQRKRRKLQHPYIQKLHRFINAQVYCHKIQIIKKSIAERIKQKIKKFHQGKSMSFTVQDVINKFGDKPKCYLTGKEIDINKPASYHFDHKIPKAKGGSNDIDNLGICTKEANLAKRDMTDKEFIEFCKTVVKNNP